MSMRLILLILALSATVYAKNQRKPQVAFLMRLDEANYKFTHDILKGFKTFSEGKYQVDLYSHQGDSKSIERAAKKIKEKKYDIVVGGETSKTAILVAEYIRDIPIISPTATSEKILDYTNLISLSSQDSKVSFKIISFLLGRIKKGERVCIFHNKSQPNTDESSKTIIDGLIERGVSKKSICVIDFFEGKKINAELMRSAIDNEVENMVVFSFEGDIRAVHNVLLHNGVHPTYIGGDSWGSNDKISKTFQAMDSNFKAIKYAYWDENKCATQRYRKICDLLSVKVKGKPNEFHAIGHDLAVFLNGFWDFSSGSIKGKNIDGMLTSSTFEILPSRHTVKDIFFYYFSNSQRKVIKL